MDITSFALKFSYSSEGVSLIPVRVSANLSYVLMYVMTDAYGSLRFTAIFSASLLLTLLHSGAIPPLVRQRIE